MIQKSVHKSGFFFQVNLSPSLNLLIDLFFYKKRKFVVLILTMKLKLRISKYEKGVNLSLLSMLKLHSIMLRWPFFAGAFGDCFNL